MTDVGFRAELDAEVEAALAEGLGDHFYGAWRGDGKGSGGRPAGGHPGGKVGQGLADAQAAAKAGPGLMDRTVRSSLKGDDRDVLSASRAMSQRAAVRELAFASRGDKVTVHVSKPLDGKNSVRGVVTNQMSGSTHVRSDTDSRVYRVPHADVMRVAVGRASD